MHHIPNSYRRKNHALRKALVCPLLLAAAPAVYAAPECPAIPPLLNVPDGEPAAGSVATVSADSVQLLEDGISRMDGNARVEQSGRVMEADSLVVNQSEGTADALGSTRFQAEGLGIEADSAHYDLESQAGEFERANYRITGAGRGDAARIATDGQKRVILNNAQFTTCPLGDESWTISADKLKIDQNTGIATAEDTVVRFKNIPFIYAPWFSFPVLVDRKSGFLIPEIGSSSETGIDITTPYYFNLARNYDFTLYPRLLASRGVQLGGELRHLGAASATQLGIEYLPSDSKANDDRERYFFEHNSLVTSDWDIGVKYDKVGDKDYFRELDTRLERTSRTFLQRSARTAFQTPGGWLTIGVLAQSFQTLDRELLRSERPFERLPQVDVDFHAPRHWLLQPGIRTQYTRFERDAGLAGDRFDIRPELAVEWDRQAWFARGLVAVRHTEYRLDGAAAGADERPSRTLPSYSMDAGLRFERMTQWGYTQTLTPRIYALHVPFEDQSDIPLFDSGLPDFQVDELFEENRFTGLDRIADASQITMAVSSDLVDPATGYTPVRATVGQIYRFDDAQIELPGVAPAQQQDPDHSDFVSALDIAWTTDFSTRFLGQYDPTDSEFNRGSVVFRYRPDTEKLINVAYRFRRGLLNQTDLSVLWPITRNWSAVGRYNYSLREDQNIELLAGLEYQSCCWATRVGWRRFVADEIGNFNNAIFLQLELTGLAQFGNGLERFIERDIVGFDPAYDPL